MKRCTAVVFDLDGTLYLDGKPIAGAADAIAAIRSSGREVIFISNNPTRTPDGYAGLLNELGIDARPSDVLTSGALMGEWLLENAQGEPVYLVGEQTFHEQLANSGVHLTDDWRMAAVVVASFDRGFHYRKWQEATMALIEGARFVATHPDVTSPFPEGRLPDCGALIAALEASSGREVEVIVGKPSSPMAGAVRRRLGIASGESLLIVGDRLDTDIALGQSLGATTALVSTGVTSSAQAHRTEYPPDVILESVADLVPWMTRRIPVI